MKPWHTFAEESPKMAESGLALLFRDRIGLAFLATLRKDGAPRLHPVNLVLQGGHLYVLIPHHSPKCADLLRDGRYALQAFPQAGGVGEEFYISGYAECILDPIFRQALINETKILVSENEVLFELLLERVMHSMLENEGTSDERPAHYKWRATLTANNHG